MTVKSITEAKKKPDTEMCCYCGLVPSKQHPDYTCPRISGVSWHDEGGGVDFIDPMAWQAIQSSLKGD